MRLILFLFILNSINAYGQEYKKKQTYKSTLHSGSEVIFRAKSLSLDDETLSFYLIKSGSTKIEITQETRTVEKIQYVSQTRVVEGFMIGTSAGFFGALAYHNLRDRESYTSSTNHMQHRWQEEHNFISPVSIGMIVGGALVGIAIGKSMVKEWITIYPKTLSSASESSFNLNFAINQTTRPQVLLSFQF